MMSFFLTPFVIIFVGTILALVREKKRISSRQSQLIAFSFLVLLLILSVVLYYDILLWPFNFDGKPVAGSIWMFHTDYTGIYKRPTPPDSLSVNIWLIVPEFISFIMLLLYPLWMWASHRLTMIFIKRRRPKKGLPRVVILGAGFAGLSATRYLAEYPFEVKLVDKNNYHTFSPLLYQVGAAELAPHQIIAPLRSILRKQSNVSFLMGEVTGINFDDKTVYVGTKNEISYDYLIVALGSTPYFFGVPGASENTFKLNSLDQAIKLRNHILSCFEQAVQESNPDLRRSLLTFTIVGGGPTGVEFAGALCELVYGTLVKDYPTLDFKEVRIILLEAIERLLLAMPEKIGNYTLQRLQKMGTEVHLNSIVSEITSEAVYVKDGDKIPSKTIVWAAGSQGFPKAKEWGLETVARGQIKLLPTLQVPEHPNVYVTGDLAYFERDGKPLQMVAPVAVQQGKTAARNILRELKGLELKKFSYFDRGTLAVIGRNKAAGQIRNLSFTGFFAWLVWLIVHIYYLIGFRNRLYVLTNWAWDYFLRDRIERLILPC
ncbi:MAG: FAD-dependent oxidoreductase [Candidatus Hermodarchaeota archaeon]